MKRSGKAIGTGVLVAWLFGVSWGDEQAVPLPVIDATSLRHKVLCGYQGWFRAPGDPAGEGWRHWSRDSSRITPQSLTFEMWPDLSEANDGEKFPAPGFTDPDGRQAHLFTATDLGIDMAYVAMFDEVDEATARFKVSNRPRRLRSPPTTGCQLTGTCG
ncbi:hypothetical protein V5E97_07850 [Singulisphaera sp. Ch08]|uniref:Uncharacterized protein n=1 Tax=Singulisphaera sp. Ch08 TaxID=3120278 RepID=A0AAU7CLN3_9BACT